MPPSDRELGLHREISRRDFLHGAGAVVAGAALGACGGEPGVPALGPMGAEGVPADPTTHPPSRLGLRGSHDGAFEVAHEMAFEGRTDWGVAHEPDPDVYDLVVVGAGVSGLAAAHFYRDAHPGARILLLENHDDFGGHARRNEFTWKERTILGYGGSQSLEAPSAYSDEAKGLLRAIGVETRRLEDAYDAGFFRRHDLGAAVFFDRATYGEDKLVRTDLIDPSSFLPVAPAPTSLDEAIAQMPISEGARKQLLALVNASEDRLPDHGLLDEPGFLETLSYRDLLTKHLGVTEPEVIGLLQDTTSGYFGHGIDAVPALLALGFGLPGLGATSLGRFQGLIRRAISWTLEPYFFHFPDGNATVARLLVRSLIPGVASGDTMEDVVTARFDYGALDRADGAVRLRLSSTVVRARHEGDPDAADRVAVTYVRGGRTERVHGRHVVLAGYNMAIPYLCPELPAEQKAALSGLVKVPYVYTNVLLRNWRALENLGVALAHCPGSWHKLVMVDFPVSLGDYAFTRGPDDPVVVHMSSAVVRPIGPPQVQSRAGRVELLTTSFETIEREIRTHLGGMLGAGGFDPAGDIEAIAVNRWPHGYAFTPNPLFDPEYGPGEAPYEVGRQRFGRIAIANSDAGGQAYLDAAIDQAWRAVGELVG